ncbi:GTP pyrophosphokinase (RelA/SpoT) [[Clostridium] ultunense Esp]|uniref:RelA/SpoT family protein n=1 Tax=Thermicanus aegyptius TaxID=94009 RepID=UPI0002B6F37D|nr:bifunctional (p)ppGpp synthetase/guanosine-3',5'-bis(diphosphate) 3'-pyrophosphohydrolase [Thermicanus aegyptius]CCQ93294.1 GTP pyrophosphokinase (RelA/SpoT) [[Clostridium] ultunense Esp]
MPIEELLDKAKEYMSDDELDMVRKAYLFAEKAHEGQLRASGDPYITHPLAVAGILADLHMDHVILSAALLHDVVEDTHATLDQVRQEFGVEVAELVDGVTKLRRIKYKSQEEQQAENHRKMLLAMAKDVRVILIKLADRLHNMRTLKYRSEEDQRRIANETLEIFAPIAHRLGISTIKWELEDISLRYINPQQYYRIVHLMKKKRAEREKYIEKVMEEIRVKLEDLGIKCDISGRPKHIYSIYRKMFLQHKEFNEIYDLLAIRIIVENVRDCYAVLGVVHTLWKPMPGRFKDYIAMPKANLYQSLHTTVIGPEGEPLEVQIRTQEMHRTAEYGIAAHWAYKEGKRLKGNDKYGEQRLSWFRELLEYQQESRDAQEFVESLKMDLFSDLVFVFTPKGDVIELPAGSVPLDFAYRIHTEIGNRCVGAKVNGKIVPLDHPLKTGDIVEILTSKHSYGPSQDWLKIAKSSHAKNKIRAWFKKERREEMIERGRMAVEQEVKKHNLNPKELLQEEYLKEAAHRFNFQEEEDMYSAVGYGGVTAAQVVTRMLELYKKDHPDLSRGEIPPEGKGGLPGRKVSHSLGVTVAGASNLLVRFSRCCNPVPGDEIVGYITRGRGVSVHRRNCPNILTEEPERLIDVEWEAGADQYYNVDIEVTGLDRNGLLNDVLQAVNETKTNITQVTGRADKNRMAMIHMSLSIKHLDHLQRVVDKVKQVKDVYAVRRLLQS